MGEVVGSGEVIKKVTKIGYAADLSTLSPKEVNEKIKGEKVDVIVGGLPCQGFSIAGKRIVEDKRNELYKSFVIPAHCSLSRRHPFAGKSVSIFIYSLEKMQLCK